MARASPCNREDLASHVETKLVSHYLSSDGPGGGASLTHIDASRRELAECLGVADTETALRQVVDSCGGDVDVSGFLASGWYPFEMAPALPGYFRYLVLTCIVVASADDNKETHEFGKNLQRLLGTNKCFANRRALPEMWRQLASWCNEQRRTGRGIRQVILPDFDRAEKYIGLTNAISFPSWRDTHQLRSRIEKSSGRFTLETPRDAALSVCPVIRADSRFSYQLRSASEEFELLYRQGASLLVTHRFWAALCRALDLRRFRQVSDAPSLSVELVLGVAPEDARLIFSQELPKRNGGNVSVADCAVGNALSVLERLRQSSHPGAEDLLHYMRAGAVPFVQERFGTWICRLSKFLPDEHWIYLVSRDRVETVQRLVSSKVERLDEHWFLVTAASASGAMHIHQVLGLQVATIEAKESIFHMRGGVRTSAGFLGRPSLLPWIEIDGNAEVSVAAAPGSNEVSVTLVERGALLSSSDRLDGQYELSLENRIEGRRVLAIHRPLRFAAAAPEHRSIRNPNSIWRDRNECGDDEWVESPSDIGRSLGSDTTDGEQDPRFDDLLELIYARGASGWPERALVDAIKELVPGPSPWDVLRTLQESGWLCAKASIRWRANLWCLVPPNLRRFTMTGRDAVMLHGSAPEAIRARLVGTVEALGGEARILTGIGRLSPVTVIAVGVPPDRLSDKLGWPVSPAKTAAPRSSAIGSPATSASVDKHQLHAEWSWEQRAFIRLDHPVPAATVAVRWWRRSESDRADLYSVDGGAPPRLVTPSRVLALVEAHRRARIPMFDERDALLQRIAADGHLPMHVAQTMHLYALRSPGVLHGPTGWLYSYPASEAGLKALRSSLGRHLVRNDVSKTHIAIRQDSGHFAHARHRGGRASRNVAP